MNKPINAIDPLGLQDISQTIPFPRTTPLPLPLPLPGPFATPGSLPKEPRYTLCFLVYFYPVFVECQLMWMCIYECTDGAEITLGPSEECEGFIFIPYYGP